MGIAHIQHSSSASQEWTHAYFRAIKKRPQNLQRRIRTAYLYGMSNKAFIEYNKHCDMFEI